jgi:hypothetical protein
VQRACTLIKFAHLIGIDHAKPYIVVNISSYSIGPEEEDVVLYSLSSPDSGLKLPIFAALYSVNQSFPLLSIVIRLVPLSFVGGEYSVISPVSASTLPILLPVSAAYQAFPSESSSGGARYLNSRKGQPN